MWNSRPEREEFLRSSHADRSFFRSEIHTRATQLSRCDIVERSFHPHSGMTRWSAGHSSDSRILFEWCRTWMGLETCGDDTIDSHTLGTPLCEKERSNTRETERCHILENDCREECHRKTEYTQNRSCQPESTSWFVLFHLYLRMQSVESVGRWIYHMCGTEIEPSLKYSVHQTDWRLFSALWFCVE